ncbi:serine hydrolase domain-containing protein [Arthrobacter caoxuetaonis]|uniref:serine hydrolase domain-containing protein n=1 Tax=Arthrobacter caoxuetaonis TaxID=2886935 RepID=UPI001D150BE2|nr:serine hydrolase domain-containing protein [Arthrobacter caoxuetaonis]MCC3283582.1 beta-lactamase family protein [Arthrobacter caoxuetaonis]
MGRNCVFARSVRLAAASVAATLLVVSCSPPDAARDSVTSPFSSPSPGVSAQDELPDKMQSALQDQLAQVMQRYGVPGAAAGVWIPGEGTWQAASGTADVAGAVPVSPGMAWPLRSITKSYTVTLLLQLADQGLVDLDDAAGQYVDGVTNGDRITLRQLAAMSSGNADYTGAEFAAEYGQNPARIFTLAELNGFVLGEPAQFEPGTQRAYTNANTNLIGAVIEKVTGQPYSEVLSEHVLEPLQLSGTTYLTDAADWGQPHPTGYIAQDGVPEPQVENPSIFAAAGSLFSTLEDTRVWAEALATGALLDADTQEERLAGAPLKSGPPYDQYALGIGETRGWWGHNGEGIGFTSAAFHDPASGATIVAFMNESNVPGAHPADEAFRSFAEVLADYRTG